MEASVVEIDRSDLFRGTPVVHGFTRVYGGVSEAPNAGGLSLAVGAGTSPDAFRANLERAVAALDWTGRVVWMDQVHGNDVVIVPDALDRASVGRADGMVSAEPGVLLAVRTADCVPVLLQGPNGVAAVHAGWRGVASEIVLRASTALGGVERAVIGPCIGLDAFEVGDEVVEALEDVGLSRHEIGEKRHKWHLDLGEAVALQLKRAGARAVDRVGGCTTQPEYFSWRGDGPETGRLAGFVGVRA